MGDTTIETTLTLSQNGALYFVEAYCGETARRRAALFRKFATAPRVQPKDINRRTFNDSHVCRKFHPDNER
jgi:hypothetical protein